MIETVYRTSDGSIFNNLSDAESYETTAELGVKVAAMLKQLTPEYCPFRNGTTATDVIDFAVENPELIATLNKLAQEFQK